MRNLIIHGHTQYRKYARSSQRKLLVRARAVAAARSKAGNCGIRPEAAGRFRRRVSCRQPRLALGPSARPRLGRLLWDANRSKPVPPRHGKVGKATPHDSKFTPRSNESLEKMYPICASMRIKWPTSFILRSPKGDNTTMTLSLNDADLPEMTTSSYKLAKLVKTQNRAKNSIFAPSNSMGAQIKYQHGKTGAITLCH